MGLKGKEHFVKIEEACWIAEALSEKFGNALQIMSNVSHPAVYGGSLRDLISGRKVEGDMDIAVAGEDRILDNLFRQSYEWLDFGKIASKEESEEMCKNYDGSKGIMSISTFINVSEALVQVVAEGNPDRENELGIPTRLARSVDIVCCGFVMSKDGRVFEVVPGAQKDCQENKLNLNKLPDTLINIEKLKKRIAKFVSRGWKNCIDLQEAIEHNEHVKASTPGASKLLGTCKSKYSWSIKAVGNM